jgi:hypothetical protein
MAKNKAQTKSKQKVTALSAAKITAMQDKLSARVEDAKLQLQRFRELKCDTEACERYLAAIDASEEPYNFFQNIISGPYNTELECEKLYELMILMVKGHLRSQVLFKQQEMAGLAEQIDKNS